MFLVFGALDIAVFFMVEVSQREKWNSGPLVMSDAVEEEERGGQPTRIFARNGIHHPHHMCDCIEPECARHLFFGEVGASHMDHHFPIRLDESVGRLALCRSSNSLDWPSMRYSLMAKPKSLIRVEAARQ